MTKYTKNHDDDTIDSVIIEIFKKNKSIINTICLMKINHNIIVSRQEISNLLKKNNLGELIKKRSKKNG